MMRALVSSPSSSGGLALAEVPEPQPDADACLIDVTTVSLNAGESRRARAAAEGTRVGWDVAGTVREPARDGTGPGKGTRVVGFLPSADGWAEVAALKVRYLAPIPETVSDEDASALPVAGLTALFGLERGERLFRNRVLITGATGGVGLFACQLAAKMGAIVVAQVRRPEQAEIAASAGAHEVVVDPTGEKMGEHGPYQLVYDGVGGAWLSNAIPKLQSGGRAIVYGVGAGPTAQLSTGALLGSGDAAIQGFNLYHESRVLPASSGLVRLLAAVKAGELRTFIQRRASWREAGEVVSALLVREFHGKAVLKID